MNDERINGLFNNIALALKEVQATLLWPFLACYILCYSFASKVACAECIMSASQGFQKL